MPAKKKNLKKNQKKPLKEVIKKKLVSSNSKKTVKSSGLPNKNQKLKDLKKTASKSLAKKVTSKTKEKVVGPKEKKDRLNLKKLKKSPNAISQKKTKNALAHTGKKAVSGENLKTTLPTVSEVKNEVLSLVRPKLDASGESICREVGCEALSTTGGYCRLHYIKNWRKIKRKELILKEGKLNRYIEELVAKYPDKYIEAIRQDLSSDRDFSKVIHDLELEENIDDLDTGDDSIESLIDGIKKDVEEDDMF